MRGKVWCFQRRAPKKLRHIINRSEIKLSLHTSDRMVAKALVQKLNAEIEQLKLGLFAGLSPELVVSTSRDRLSLLQRASQAVAGNTLQKLSERYLHDRRKEGMPVKEESFYHGTFKLVGAFLGSRPITEYRRKDILHFRSLVEKMPPHLKIMELPETDLRHIASAEHKKRVALSTVNSRLLYLSAFFAWCVKHEHGTSNPCKGSLLQRKERADELRKALNADDLQRLFSSPAFQGAPGKPAEVDSATLKEGIGRGQD